MTGSNLCIPRNKTAQSCYFQNRIIMFWFPISTFMYLWAQYRTAYFAAAKLAHQSWEYINRSQIHECRNCDRDRAVSFWEHINRIFRTVYDNPFPTRFLAPKECSKISAQSSFGGKEENWWQCWSSKRLAPAQLKDLLPPLPPPSPSTPLNPPPPPPNE